MTGSIRTAVMAGLATIACVVALSACGGSTPSSSSSSGTQASGSSPPPGPGDSRICTVVSQAKTAYNAKDFTTWRSDMILIGDAADSAQYVPIKNYAEDLKQATSSSTTTTTKPKSKARRAGGVHVSGLFDELGAFVGLQHACAQVTSQ
jgi:hypothetical protein